jgi:hypothetical protein
MHGCIATRYTIHLGQMPKEEEAAASTVNNNCWEPQHQPNKGWGSSALHQVLANTWPLKCLQEEGAK